jgi:hypothetical protein
MPSPDTAASAISEIVTPLDFWSHYGICGGALVIVAFAIFPRLALFLAPVHLSPLQWLGWALCPSVIVALISTQWWVTDPGIALGAWAVAILKPAGILLRILTWPEEPGNPEPVGSHVEKNPCGKYPEVIGGGCNKPKGHERARKPDFYCGRIGSPETPICGNHASRWQSGCTTPRGHAGPCGYA